MLKIMYTCYNKTDIICIRLESNESSDKGKGVKSGVEAVEMKVKGGQPEKSCVPGSLWSCFDLGSLILFHILSQFHDFPFGLSSTSSFKSSKISRYALISWAKSRRERLK